MRPARSELRGSSDEADDPALVAALRTGDLTAFEKHLSACPDCRAYLATYRATVDLGRVAFAVPEADAQTEVPDELLRAILNALRQ